MAIDDHARHAWPQRGGVNADERGARGAATTGIVQRAEAAADRASGTRPITTLAAKPHVSLIERAWKTLVWTVVVFFLLNILLLIATVAVNSIATRWFGTPLPEGFTLH